jgi:hypothetical protein
MCHFLLDVEESDDFQAVGSQPIGNDVPGLGHDLFPECPHPAKMA